MVQEAEADLLLEASPANMADGQPGLGCIEAALGRGMHVVTANKAPLVLAFPRLLALAHERGVQLRFDATVAGGLPAVNLGQRDLAFADVHRLEGVLNLTTNYILTRMADDGLSYDEALADAQAAGHAETDPTLDVEGWDAANKLVILAHSVLGQPATLADVAVEGILGVTPDDAGRGGCRGASGSSWWRPPSRTGEGYRLSVRPTWLDGGPSPGPARPQADGHCLPHRRLRRALGGHRRRDAGAHGGGHAARRGGHLRQTLDTCQQEGSMTKVYRSYAGPDDYVGRVEANGRVYGQRLGPDDYLGRVERNGRIYAHEPGPDRYLGRVERDGEIFRHVPGGPDVEVGRVEENGKVYARRPGPAPDDLIGRVEGESPRLAGGAAFFLLLGGVDNPT